MHTRRARNQLLPPRYGCCQHCYHGTSHSVSPPSSPLLPLIHNHKSRLNCVGVGIPPLGPRLLSPSPIKTLSGTCRGIWDTSRRPSGVETSVLGGCMFTTFLLEGESLTSLQVHFFGLRQQQGCSLIRSSMWVIKELRRTFDQSYA